MVANFDPVSKPGTHWVAMYAPNTFHVYYFDSTGGDGVENLNDYMKNHFPMTTKQHMPLQHPKTKVCGHYALYFIYMSARGTPFETIERFLTRIKHPDVHVYNFIEQIFPTTKRRRQ